MVKISDKPFPRKSQNDNSEKPDDTKSTYKAHNSGKVQKTISSNHSLYQVNHLQTSIQRVYTSKKQTEIKTEVENTLTTHHTQKSNVSINQKAQTYESVREAKDDINVEYKTLNSTTQADQITETRTAKSHQINHKKFTHQLEGSLTVCSNKELILNSQNLTLQGGSGSINAIEFGGGGQSGVIEAGNISIKADKHTVVIGNQIVMDDEYKPEKAKYYDSCAASEYHKDPGSNKACFYLQEVIYCAETSMLYFFNRNQLLPILSSQQSLMYKFQSLEDNMRNYLKKKFAINQYNLTGLEGALKDDGVISNNPTDYVWVIHLFSQTQVWVKKDLLNNTSLQVPISAKDIQDGEIKLEPFIEKAKEKLEKPLTEIAYTQQKLFQESIDFLSRFANDQTKTKWLDLGKNPRQNLLMAGLMLPIQIGFADYKKVARKPSMPARHIPFVLGDEKVTYVDLYSARTNEVFVSKLNLMAEVFAYDSELLLADTIKGQFDPEKGVYALETAANNDYQCFYNDNRNRINRAKLYFNLTQNDHPNNGIDQNIETAFYKDNSKVKAQTLSDDQAVYISFNEAIEFNQETKKSPWIIHLNMKRMFENFNYQAVRDDLKNHPKSDALPLMANHQSYAFESAMYYLAVHCDYDLVKNNIISKEDNQKLTDRYIDCVLQAVGTSLTCQKLKETYQNKEDLADSFSLNLASRIIQLDQMQNPLLSILPPDVIGKLLFLIADHKDIDRKTSQAQNTLRDAKLILLKWLPSQKANSLMLKHYQPVNEYDEVDPAESVQTLWNEHIYPRYSDNHNKLKNIDVYYNNDDNDFAKTTTKSILHQPTIAPATDAIQNYARFKKINPDDCVGLIYDTETQEFIFLTPQALCDLSKESEKLRAPLANWQKQTNLKDKATENDQAVDSEAIKSAEEELHKVMIPYFNKEVDMKEVACIIHKDISEVAKSINENADKLNKLFPWNYMDSAAYSAITGKLLKLKAVKSHDGALNDDGNIEFKKTVAQQGKISDKSNSTKSTTDFNNHTKTAESKREENATEVTRTTKREADYSKTTTDKTTRNRAKFKGVSFSDLKESMQKEYTIPKWQQFFHCDAGGVDKQLFNFTDSLEKALNKADDNDELTHLTSFLDMQTTHEVKLMRYTAVANFDTGFNPIKQTLNAVGTAKVGFNLWNGSAGANFFYPGVYGKELSVDLLDQHFSFGLFRGKFGIKLYSEAGASVMLSSQIEIDTKPLTKTLINKVKKQTGHEPQEGAQTNALIGKSQFSIDAGAFAGVTAGCELVGGIEWASPEGIDQQYVTPIENPSKASESLKKPEGKGKPSFMTLAEVTLDGAASVGFGAKSSFELSYDPKTGNLVFGCMAQTVFEVGLKGCIKTTIGTKTIYEMIIFIYHQLKNMNFHIEQAIENFISQEAFDIVSKLIAVAVWAGEEIEEFISEFGKLEDKVSNWFVWFDEYAMKMASSFKAIVDEFSGKYATRIEDLAHNLLATPSYNKVKFSTPQTKGLWLYQLAKYNQVCHGVVSKEPFEAMVWILDHIQSFKDYQETMRYCVDINEKPVLPSQGQQNLLNLLGQMPKAVEYMVSTQDRIQRQELASSISNLLEYVMKSVRYEALRNQAVNRLGMVQREAFKQQAYHKCLDDMGYDNGEMSLYTGMGADSGLPSWCEKEAVRKTDKEFSDKGD